MADNSSSTSSSRRRKSAGAIGVAALAAWTFAPVHIVTGAIALVACAFHTVRLFRWRGLATWPEKLLFVLHAAYAFVPLGFLAISAGAIELLGEYPVMHVLTVGVIASMMLAVMTRASLGHSGRDLTATPATQAIYGAVAFAALARIVAPFLGDQSAAILTISGGAWTAAFAGFVDRRCRGRRRSCRKAASRRRRH